MMRARRKFRTLGLGVFAVASVSLAACNESGKDGDDGCVSDEEFFTENIYTPILAQTCQNCHNPQGAAKATSFIVRGPEWGPDYIAQNLEVFGQLAKLNYDGTPWILLKPTNDERVGHEGGNVIAKDSDDYKAFTEMVERLENPTACASDGDQQETFFEGVELLDEVATLRKAVLALAGRLPTIEEEEWLIEQISADPDNEEAGFAAVDAILDNVMKEDAFYERLTEIYNDFFLTDRYYDGTAAIDLLRLCDGEEDANAVCYRPESVYWFDELPEGEQRDIAANYANRGVAREGLALINYVVRNDLPYTEILTADYTMVNPFSAKTFGVFEDVQFNDPNNYNEYVPANLPGLPHAGVLTSTVWMVRFPTTDTNRNRHRSRMLADFFLSTDFQALGSRPVDAASIAGINPTMNNEQCAVCHAQVDPIAGAFQNWDEMGAYAPREEGWYADMREPGFGENKMPFEESPRALQWLAREVVKDRRFALSAIRIMYKGLTGQEPLHDPDDPNADGYLEAVTAKKIQTLYFDDIAQKFIDSNYNLKTVVKELVRTPYYRASNAYDLSEVREKELEDLGTGRLLIPEQLNRKIIAATGLPWRNGGPDEETDYLTDENTYMLFYGGIDSDDVVTRITEPSGVMANIAKRMSNEMSCLAVPQDFAKAPADRKLFPLVEPDIRPEDDNGYEIESSALAIKSNIQYMAQRLWGEFLELDDPEIQRAYDLYIDVWKDGQTGLAIEGETGYGEGLPGQCQAWSDYWNPDVEYTEDQAVFQDPDYTIRAWMAVTSYMLSDYKFLTE